MAEYIRSFVDIKSQQTNTEEHPTQTTDEQRKVEISVETIFEKFIQQLELEPDMKLLLRREHESYLYNCINSLPENYQCLDSSRPWVCFWILNAACMLGYEFSESIKNGVVSFLEKCRGPNGGFCGGPGQSPHLAPTYAAVNALVIIGTTRAYEVVDRTSLKQFLHLMRDPSGGFYMHEGGELDVRGAYCAISVAKLTRIDDNELFVDTAKWIAGCQTYEGGFGGYPNMEAHGGYTFCASAALTLLGDSANCNLQNLLRWTVNRQMKLEGGFQGRTNKLVDGCYSFWQGASVPIIQALIVNEKQNLNLVKTAKYKASMESNSPIDDIPKPESRSTDENTDKCIKILSEEVLFNRGALQEYVLFACQLTRGGLVDKPGKPRDLYHTCYTLGGLSIAQHGGRGSSFCIGGSSTEVNTTHILHNVPPTAVEEAYAYFDQLNYKQETDNDEENERGDNDKNYVDCDITEGFA